MFGLRGHISSVRRWCRELVTGHRTGGLIRLKELSSPAPGQIKATGCTRHQLGEKSPMTAAHRLCMGYEPNRMVVDWGKGVNASFVSKVPQCHGPAILR